jgi:hypothetical protein
VTDHKAEAIRISQLAHDNADQDHYERADHQMQRAQMHATLYLAEQQRLANLIAIWTVSDDDAAQLLKAGVDFGAISKEIVAASEVVSS